jgi:uncharacterized membrane protein YhaH (DUF805 family)
MIEWMILPLKRYVDFKGRSRRKEFWSWVLFNVLVGIVLYAIFFATGGGAAMMTAAQENPGDVMAIYGSMFGGVGLLFVLWWLATLLPNIAVCIRRLHDRDMSGWWYLGVIIASMIPFVGFIAAIAFLVIMFLPGTPGPNRFGPDPKDPAGAEVFA